MAKMVNASGGHMSNQSNGPVGERAKNFKGTLKTLLSYFGKYKIALAIVVIFAIASTIFTIIGPKYLGNATTEIYQGIIGQVSGTSNGINFSKIAEILLFLTFLYVLSFAFSYLQGFIMTGISMKISYKLRDNIEKKINKMPLSYFDRVNHGEVLSRVTNDVDTLSQTLNQSVTQIITSVVTVIGIIVMMFTISWQMLLRDRKFTLYISRTF